MVITGSYRGEEDDSVYFWTRRFGERGAPQGSSMRRSTRAISGGTKLAPNVVDLIDRDLIQVTRVVPTPRSVAQ